VIVVFGVLAPLVVGALRTAGGEARLAKCLGNLGHVMRATQQYTSDYQYQFPIQNWASDGWGVNSWVYGGKTNSEFWRTFGVHVPVHERPLNAYVLGAEPQPDVMDGNDIVIRTEVPVFRCPDDRTCYQREYIEPPTPISTYDDVGNSYHFNFLGIDNTNAGLWGPESAAMITTFMRDGMRTEPERSLCFVGDPTDYGFIEGVAVIGNHGEFNRHAVAFFDGHAGHMQVDTRKFCGPDWIAINSNWVRQMGKPRPPIYYADAAKKCAP
jgi:hypothetical protein